MARELLVYQRSFPMLPPDVAAQMGLASGFSIINKFGRNLDIDTASVPEDVWNGGGLYTGFPDTDAETVSVSSSSANDTNGGSGAWAIEYSGLDTNYKVQTERLNLNGTTPVTGTKIFRRIHTARIVAAASATTFNAGTITCTHSTTTSNVFFVMPAGTNQTRVAAYTIPAGFTGYLIRKGGVVRGSAGVAGTVDGAFVIREFGEVFRTRRPFTFTNTARLNDHVNGGLILPEKTDIVARITYASANNLDVTMDFDIFLAENQ